MPFIKINHITPNCYVVPYLQRKRSTVRAFRDLVKKIPELTGGRLGFKKSNRIKAFFHHYFKDYYEYDNSSAVQKKQEVHIRLDSCFDQKDKCEHCTIHGWCPRHTWREDMVYTLSQRTDALLKGLDLIFEHHGASKEIRKMLNDQVHGYLDINPSEKLWLACAKHMLAYPLAKYLNNDPPVGPSKVFEPSGNLRRWWRKRIIAFNRKNTHLWYSWYQAKRSSLPVSMEFVEDTYQDHFKTLTRKDPGNEDTINSIFEDRTFKSVLRHLRSEVTRKMKKSDFREESASNSACFSETRSSGGQQASLLKVVNSYACFNSIHSDLESMSWCPRTFGRQIKTNVVTEHRIPKGFEDWHSLKTHAKGCISGAPINCTIQAVLEPMKVRVISKGESLPYYLMKPLQKAMHGSMRKMECFRLIGQPFCPTNMIDLKVMSSPTDEWFSIDYSAATDGLSWKYSGRILRYLIGDLPIEQQEAALAVLGPHNLHYPRPMGQVDYWGTQENGQLMGSILSFPILCLANLGVYLLANQSRQSTWTNKQRLGHVLINGDDMLYSAPHHTWSEHVRIGEEVGLKMSIGKAYTHPVYANVNSTSIHFDLRVPNATPWKIDFLNCGLFFGQHKVQGRHDGKEHANKKAKKEISNPMDEIICRFATDETVNALYAKAKMAADPAAGLTPNINTILRGSLPGKQAALMRYFLIVHKDELRRECTLVVRRKGRTSLRTRNIFLPITCGGMGAECPIGFKFKVTQFDRNLAKFFRDAVDLPITQQDPLPGYPPIKLDTGMNAPWYKKISVPEIAGVGLGLSSEQTVEVEEKRYNILLKLHPKLCRTGFKHFAPNATTFY
jgi:hypothetical protein